MVAFLFVEIIFAIERTRRERTLRKCERPYIRSVPVPKFRVTRRTRIGPRGLSLCIIHLWRYIRRARNNFGFRRSYINVRIVTREFYLLIPI
jgi:hypothetical protein